MVKFLGAIDLFAAAILLSIGSKVHIPLEVLIFILVCLFFKACISIFDIGGITDLAVLILILLSIFLLVPWPILLIGAALMIIKGVMSLFA